jgi:hypothetical protein
LNVFDIGITVKSSRSEFRTVLSKYNREDSLSPQLLAILTDFLFLLYGARTSPAPCHGTAVARTALPGQPLVSSDTSHLLEAIDAIIGELGY